MPFRALWILKSMQWRSLDKKNILNFRKHIKHVPITDMQSHESNPGMLYSENHALDSAILPISRIKERAQLTNENR